MSKFTKVVLIGKETDWGTAVTPTKDIGIVTDISDNLSRSIKQSQGLTSLSTQHITSGMVDVNQSVSFEFQHGRILEYAIGSVSHTETTGDWKHTFTASDNPPSMTIESSEPQDTDTGLTYAGMLLNDLSISTEIDGVLKCSANLNGKTVAEVTSAGTAVESSLPNFNHCLSKVYINDVLATVVQSITINITKNVNRVGGLGSNIYQHGKATELKFNYSAQLSFTNNDYQTLFLGGGSSPSATSDPTTYNFKLDATNGVALGSGSRRLYLELENVINPTFNKTASIGNMVFVDVTGEGTLSECYTVDNISSTNW